SRTTEGGEVKRHLPYRIGNAEFDFLSFAFYCQVLLLRLGQPGLNEAVRDGVYINVESAPFPGHCLGHTDDSHLAGRIVYLAGIPRDPRSGRDIDYLPMDPAAFGCFSFGDFTHIRCGGADYPERGRQVYVDHGIPLFVGHVLNNGVPGITCIIDYYVEAAE